MLAGLDGSLRNFGIALMSLDTDTLDLQVQDLTLITTEKGTAKTVRKSSDNLSRASILSAGIEAALKSSRAASAFLEVPSGGQSYDAVLGFGIVIGLYAGLRVPVMEVSPAETKLAAVGTKTASKEEMIEWATTKYPTAPWLMTKRGGVMVPTKANEHLADAVAIVHAGILTPAFQQTLSMLRAQAQNAA